MLSSKITDSSSSTLLKEARILTELIFFLIGKKVESFTKLIGNDWVTDSANITKVLSDRAKLL